MPFVQVFKKQKIKSNSLSNSAQLEINDNKLSTSISLIQKVFEKASVFYLGAAMAYSVSFG